MSHTIQVLDPSLDRGPKTGVGPAYRIRTSRLSIRPWQPDDADAFFASVWANHEHIQKLNASKFYSPPDVETAAKQIRYSRGLFDLGRDFAYGVFEPDNATLVGAVELHPVLAEDALMVGYWIDQDRLRKGFATEAVAALVNVVLFTRWADRVEIRCSPRNIASVRVAEGLGFVHEATLRRRYRDPDGMVEDVMIWTLFADELGHSIASNANIEAIDFRGRPLI